MQEYFAAFYGKPSARPSGSHAHVLCNLTSAEPGGITDWKSSEACDAIAWWHYRWRAHGLGGVCLRRASAQKWEAIQTRAHKGFCDNQQTI